VRLKRLMRLKGAWWLGGSVRLKRLMRLKGAWWLGGSVRLKRLMRLKGRRPTRGAPYIELVPELSGSKGKTLRFVVSHISRKTSEMWGTRSFVEGSKDYSRAVRRRRALVITETELKLMAAAAIMGFRSNPNRG
jgi:hypothetical protein